MTIYSLKVQTFVARWKLFLSSNSAIFVDDAVPQWLLYFLCGHKKMFDQIFGFCGQKGQLQLKFITGDETCVHQYYPETQAQSMAWKHPRSPTIKNWRYQPALGNLWRQSFGTWMVCFCCTFPLLMKQSILLLIRPLSKNLRELLNARGRRCRTRGCCYCMTMPDRIQFMRQWTFWNDGAGNFLSIRPTARIWHLWTFISSPTWQNIFVRSDSNHMMTSSMRCKHVCLVRIPPSVNRVLRNGFPA